MNIFTVAADSIGKSWPFSASSMARAKTARSRSDENKPA
jgi:hypothetical protein